MASQHPEVPGEPTKTGTALLETATSAVQGLGPLNKIHQHLCAYVTHFTLFPNPFFTSRTTIKAIIWPKFVNFFETHEVIIYQKKGNDISKFSYI